MKDNIQANDQNVERELNRNIFYCLDVCFMLLKLAHQQQKLLKLKGKKKKPQSACQKDNVLWMAYSVWQANTVLRDNGCRDKSHRGDSPPLTLRSNQTGRMWEKSNHLISGGNKYEVHAVIQGFTITLLSYLCNCESIWTLQSNTCYL